MPLAQKSRMCFAGSIRDVILMKNFDLLSIIAALFAVMTIYNIATGNFHLSFRPAHCTFAASWNILACTLSVFLQRYWPVAALRQLILAGQGSSDSAVTFLTSASGCRFCTQFLIWSAAPLLHSDRCRCSRRPGHAGKIAVIVCIVLLFVIAATNLRRKAAK